MFMHAIDFRYRRAAGVSIIAAALLLGAVSPTFALFGGSGPKRIRVSVQAAADLNQCQSRPARAVNCRILFVTDPSRINAVGLVQVWGYEKEIFGDKLLGTQDFDVTPSEVIKDAPFTPPLGTTHVIVVGNFACAKADGWYLQREIKKAKKMKLLAGKESLSFR